MPLYDYECEDCKITHEELVRFENGKPTRDIVCPNCQKPSKRVTVSKANFVLKGKGWARDGYS